MKLPGPGDCSFVIRGIAPTRRDAERVVCTSVRERRRRIVEPPAEENVSRNQQADHLGESERTGQIQEHALVIEAHVRQIRREVREVVAEAGFEVFANVA